jgi:hypothetical protein
MDMATVIGNVISSTIDRLVRGVIVPVTSLIPFLVSSGILLMTFAALWILFGVALAVQPDALDHAWCTVTALPLPVQGFAWLLFMPLMVGLWISETDWQQVVRLVLIAGIAGWNLMVFIPRRGEANHAALES